MFKVHYSTYGHVNILSHTHCQSSEESLAAKLSEEAFKAGDSTESLVDKVQGSAVEQGDFFFVVVLFLMSVLLVVILWLYMSNIKAIYRESPILQVVRPEYSWRLSPIILIGERTSKFLDSNPHRINRMTSFVSSSDKKRLAE